MQIKDLLTADRVRVGLQVNSKKRALELISEVLGESSSDLSQNELFTSLINREKLGSTGLGHGVALPHGRVTNIERAMGAFIRLDNPIDFDAIDGAPIDLIFTLVVPEHSTNEHLSLLAQLAQMFSDTQFCEALRSAENDTQLLELLLHWQPEAENA